MALLACCASGCTTIRAMRAEQAEYETNVTLLGSVRTASPSSDALVVVLIRFQEDGEGEIVDHYTVLREGSWLFRAAPGRYALAAFQDRSGDLVYHPDEPALPGTHVVQRGENLGEIAERYLGSARDWTRIRDLNELPNDRVKAGMVLRIPPDR